MVLLSQKTRFVLEACAAALVGLILCGYVAGFSAWCATGQLSVLNLFASGVLPFVGCAALIAVIVLLACVPACREWAFHYRYVIGALVVALACLCQCSGSSIGAWSYLESPESGLLFGTPRLIRNDEWRVLTSFFLSQTTDGFPLVSDVIRATDTVTSIVYTLPSWSLATLFHPFLIGFLVLPFGSGLAFFWVGRLVAMYLALFECLRLVCHDHRGMAAAFAALVTFSPIVQWWFAVNGIAELFIFGCALVVLFDRFLRCQGNRAAWGLSIALAYCASSFVLVFYPAWQIPLFYVFAAMGVWVFLRWRSDVKKRKAPQFLGRHAIVALLVSVLVFGTLVGVVLIQGWSAVCATLNTAYPGHRVSTGGRGLLWVLDDNAGYLLPFNISSGANVCEDAGLLSCFPLGLGLGLLAVILKRDRLSIALLVVYTLMAWFLFFGMPEWVANLTLMGRTTVNRVPLATGFIELLLIARGMTVLSGAPARWRAVVLACCLACLVLSVGLSWDSLAASFGVDRLLAIVIPPTFAAVALLAWFLPTSRGHAAPAMALGVCLTFAFSAAGICVNPIQMGTSALTGSDAYQLAQSMAEDDPSAIWLVEDSGMGQLAVAAGASTINCVNVYPDVERWELLDPTGQYENVWNRYAHIYVTLVSDEPTSFKLLTPDSFRLYLNVEDMQTLGVSYLATTQNVSAISAGDVTLTPVASAPGLGTVYQVSYAS